MNKIILFLFLLLSTVNYSQTEKPNITVESNDKIIYLDSMRLKSSEKNNQFYRIIKDYKLDKSSYIVYEFSKSGVLEMQGTANTKEGISSDGERIYYYENGNKKSATEYVKHQKLGKDVQWYENGNVKLEGEYVEDDKKGKSQHKINQFWDMNGVQKVINGNGFFDLQEENESAKGEIKNGFKVGIWEGSFTKEMFSYKETYKNGKLISGISTDTKGNTFKYTDLDVIPEPKNGMKDFYMFIAQNYDLSILPKGLSGKVYTTFVVNKEGKIKNIRVLRDIAYGTGKETIRILKIYNGFEPGKHRGLKVSDSLSLPISIQSAN